MVQEGWNKQWGSTIEDLHPEGRLHVSPERNPLIRHLNE